MNIIKWTACTFLTLSMAHIAQAAEEAPACPIEISNKGNFFTGTLHSATQEFAAVAPQDAFKRAYADTLNIGYRISAADREIGMISASQDVVMGHGKTAAYNITIEPVGTGSKVTVSLSAGTGMIASQTQMAKRFCGLFAAIAKQ